LANEQRFYLFPHYPYLHSSLPDQKKLQTNKTAGYYPLDMYKYFLLLKPNLLYLDDSGRLSTRHAFIQLIDGLRQVLRQLLESITVPVVVLRSKWLQDLEGNAIEP
jgi:hypothetical protein